MKYLWIILFILLIPTTTAIRINEVELNPAGSDTGQEWIELYCKSDTELQGYKLTNNDGQNLELSGKCDGYYVYVFEKQWLDNSDEKVFLYQGDKLIDETDLLKDDKNDDYTWFYCSDWEFGESTKGEKNNCEKEKEEKDEENFILENGTVEGKVEKNNTNEVLVLNPKDIKNIENNSKQDKTKYFYGFAFFCVLLACLWILKIIKNGQRRNKRNQGSNDS